MVQFIQNYSCIFEDESPDKEDETEECSTLRPVQVLLAAAAAGVYMDQIGGWAPHVV